MVASPEHGAERFDEPGLAEIRARRPAAMAARKQRDQRLIHHLVLAEDHPPDRGPDLGDAGAQRLDSSDEGIVALASIQPVVAALSHTPDIPG